MKKYTLKDIKKLPYKKEFEELLNSYADCTRYSSTDKEYLWRPIMKAQLNKESTTEMTTKDIDQIFDTINRHLGEKFGLHLDFPSIESLMMKSRIKSG